MTVIRIGAIDYEYIEVEGLRSEGDAKFNGLINYNDCKIKIEASLSTQAKRQTIWHEIIHGILAHSGIPDQSDKEGLCDALAYGVIGALRDNPWLKDDCKEVIHDDR